MRDPGAAHACGEGDRAGGAGDLRALLEPQVVVDDLPEQQLVVSADADVAAGAQREAHRRLQAEATRPATWRAGGSPPRGCA